MKRRTSRFYTVLRVHAGDAILTNNWHTNEVFDHARNNFEGYTFAMRTLEAWGAMIENEHRAYYTAGGRVWVLDLEPAAGKKPRPRHRRQEVANGCGEFFSSTTRRKSPSWLSFALRDRGYEVFRHRLYHQHQRSPRRANAPMRSCSTVRCTT